MNDRTSETTKWASIPKPVPSPAERVWAKVCRDSHMANRRPTSFELLMEPMTTGGEKLITPVPEGEIPWDVTND